MVIAVSHADLLDLARQKGTDKQYREWIQRQPSCISGQWSEWMPDLGEGRCEAAHWRTAATSGTGFKAPYSCIPLTGSEHRIQHQRGQSVLGDRDWWQQMVERYLKLWIAS